MSCNVAYCGGMDPKDYSVATQLFPDARKVDFSSYDKTYKSVVDGECDYAVMPFEASFHGEIGHVLDLMYNGDLYVQRVVAIKNNGETVRYAVLTKEDPHNEFDDDKWFMLMFTVKDEKGSLAKAINAISDSGFNMRALRSRPMGDLPWHYYFYAEAKGDDTSETGTKMIEELGKACETVKVLGRYESERLYEKEG